VGYLPGNGGIFSVREGLEMPNQSTLLAHALLYLVIDDLVVFKDVLVVIALMIFDIQTEWS
jgi:hypothetical protein